MNEEKIDTIIGEDIVFKGSLKFSNTLKIKGQFKGTIESNGELIVGETGQVDADIIIGSLSVNGVLKGNIEANNKVEVGKTGVIVGDVKTPLLQIDTGAKFTGSCIM